MTVPSEVNEVSYVGAASVGPFAIPFYFLENDDLSVIKKTIADGVETALVLTTDYTVTGAGVAAGGALTLIVALPATHEIHIIRDPDKLQNTDYARNDPFPAETHEKALDKLTMLVQRLSQKFKRAIKAPETETADQTIGSNDWLNRASRVVGFDAAKNLTLFTVTQLAAVFNNLNTIWYSQKFSGDGVTVNPTFNMTVAPPNANGTHVSISGVVQRPTIDFTVAGTVLTIIGVVPAGADNVLVQYGEAVPSAAVIADGSITTPKLADGVLAATAAGLAKMAAGFFVVSANALAKFADGFWQIGGHTKWVDGFWAASAAVRAKFADGIWTFAKIDAGAIASQAEAEAGTSAAKLMTPQRTAQAIAALASAVNSGVMQVLGCDCKNNAGTPNTQFDLDADTIVLRTAASAIKIKDAPGAAITNNTATAGPAANGRDQAGAFAAGWVHFYWIAKADGTLATVSSNVAPPTGPTLPADYTFWAYAGAVYYDGAALRNIRVKGSQIYYRARQPALVNGTATAESTQSVSTFVPPNALDFKLIAEASIQDSGLSGPGPMLAILRHIAGIDFVAIRLSFAAGGHAGSSLAVDMPNVGQQFYWLFDSGLAAVRDLDVWVIGYSVPNGGE